ncbi:MAG: crosslink repair DNA glycosylase YcaQ family protein [Planctomycetota bacterium]
MPERARERVVPAEVARLLFLEAQGLLDDPGRRCTPRALVAEVERLGLVQVDTIRVVARAHDHILWTRFEGYRPAMLERLIRRRLLFEHWTHDASVLPVSFAPWWNRRCARTREQDRHGRWWRERLGPDYERLRTAVYRQLEEVGELRSRDLDSPRLSDSSWWGWKQDKALLEHLWMRGEVGIARREEFHKVYAPMDTLHPELLAEAPPDEAYVDWSCAAALERLGTATTGELCRYFRNVSPAEAKAWAERAVADGRAVELPVRDEGEDAKVRRLLAVPDWRRRLARARRRLARPCNRGLRLLSPFDPVVRDRDRLLRLFGFDYRFEAFVPAPRRRWGYYVLPLLRGDRFVGRLDAKLHRDRRALERRGLWWEKGHGGAKAPRKELTALLARYRDFALS